MRERRPPVRLRQRAKRPRLKPPRRLLGNPTTPATLSTPSGNIVCWASNPAQPSGDITCTVLSTRGRPDGMPFAWYLPVVGTARRLPRGEPGDTRDSLQHRLPYGSTWQKGDLWCRSETSGLTCLSFRSRNGFFVSKERQRLIHSGAITPGPSATTAHSVLPDCVGTPVARPKIVTLSCADAGIVVSVAAWRDWGSSSATSVGTASVNDCTPSCAAGARHDYRVKLIASGHQQCPNGQIAYARVTYSFLGRSPYPPGSPGAVHPVVEYPCHPVP